MTVLVTGGSGSGKSAFAEELLAALAADGRVYIATMEVFDEESRRRVTRHRAQRADKGFVTLECPRNLMGADIPEGAAALLEDLPNLVAGEMFGGGDVGCVMPGLAHLARRCAHLVVVTGDVFSDGVTYDPATQTYLRTLGEAARAFAAMADAVVEVVCSLPVVLKGALPCLGSTDC